MRISTRVVIDIASGAVVEREGVEYFGPVALALSGGVSGSQSSSSSRTKFPRKFFDEAYGYFGPEPTYNPKFVGFDDFDKLEENIYGSQQSKLDQAFRRLLQQNDERLSQSGLLNSPNQYLRGGATEGIQNDYITNLQQAARDASQARLGAQQQEAGRETAFNVDTATKLYNAFLQKLTLAAQAGRQTKGSSSSSGMNFDIKI